MTGKFRVVAYAEAVTYLMLLAEVIVLHGFGGPDFVKIMGPVHGVVFLVYFVLVLNVRDSQGWGWAGPCSSWWPPPSPSGASSSGATCSTTRQRQRAEHAMCQSAMCQSDRELRQRSGVRRPPEADQWPQCRLGAGADGAATGPTVPSALAQLTALAEQIRTAELYRYRGRLSGLDDHQRAVVEPLTRSIVAGLLRRPAVVLAESASPARADQLGKALCDLFGMALRGATWAEEPEHPRPAKDLNGGRF